MSQNIHIWIPRLWSIPFIPSCRSRMKRNKEISWFLTKDFQLKLLSWEWSKMYTSGWQHISTCIGFPVILRHDCSRALYVSLRCCMAHLFKIKKSDPEPSLHICLTAIDQVQPAAPASMQCGPLLPPAWLHIYIHQVSLCFYLFSLYTPSTLKNPLN